MQSPPVSSHLPIYDRSWPVRLFNKSVLKQRKLKEILAFLGPTSRLHCLDIGSDNGVVSYFLRKSGGVWKSADLDEGSVSAIARLVESEVYQIDGGPTPFREDEFDHVVIVDFLEHIPDDRGFVQELYRIIKPGGELIINVPNIKNSWLRKFRIAIGQTDEKHGHLRPGYKKETLENLLGDRFTLLASHTYSKFFSEAMDTLIVYSLSRLKKDQPGKSRKGIIIDEKDLKAYRMSFLLYSLIYPAVWLISQLDALLFFTSGYMLIAKARVNKRVKA
jgi:SAM-dependent methyltransferase